MAKENKTTEAAETAIEAATPTVKAKSEAVTVIELKQGQAAVSPVDTDDENMIFITSISDWHAKFNAGVNKGKYKLIAEKKS